MTIQRATRTDIIQVKCYNIVGEAIQPYASRKTEITVEDDCVHWGSCVNIPKCLQVEILKELRTSGASRHLKNEGLS